METTAPPFAEFHIGDAYPMYVQRWRPTSANAARLPVVLIHGGAHTGICWTTCPDGRPGWARRLTDLGYETFVVDWPGVGRSGQMEDFLTSGPGPAIEALIALLRETGPALLIGHSIGAALAIKVADEAPDLVRAIMAIAPAPPGILKSERPQAPADRPVIFDAEAVAHVFSNADRFPAAALATYRRSLCPLSPSILNAVASDNRSALTIRDPATLARKPTLVIAGDQDQLVLQAVSEQVAAFIGGSHVLVGRDWGFAGYGHMIPIEIDSEAILERGLEHLATVDPSLRAGPP
jgi:pimeloyl-ACP methyl ester carboxylesterase